MRSTFFDRIQINPIIAAVSDLHKLDKALDSPCEIIFLLTGNIFNLKEIVDKAKSKGKCIFIHIDLIDGFSRNVTALRYINEHIKPDGIISTKATLIKAAKEMHMFAIQRFFIIDSLSLNNAIDSLKSLRPDAAEILPGVMGKITSTINNQSNRPIIAGGLIKDKEDVISSLKAGAIGISTTDEKIWDM